MSSEQLADGVNPLDAELAATWDVLKGYSGRDTDLGIARRFGGAAAAYSLRDIGAMNGRVVKVRRDVDGDGTDKEEDFSANQVQSGALEDWVNGKLESTLPADVDTAAAAYSLRQVKEGYGVPMDNYPGVNLPSEFGVTLEYDGTDFSIKETGSDFLANYIGSTVFISPSGDDSSGDGSSGNPYKTLDKAITEASDNDKISLASGTYAMPTSDVNKSVAIVCPSGTAYIGTFNNLSSATIDTIDTNTYDVYNVDDIDAGETFRGYIRTDGTLVSGVRGSAISTTSDISQDYASKGIMAVRAGATSANFVTGTSETLQSLVSAGSILAWTDGSTDKFKVSTGKNVYIGSNIILASYATNVVETTGTSEIVLDGCEVYGGSNSSVDHKGSGRLLMFDTIISGANGDNIDYGSTAIGIESNITSSWCNRGASDNTSTAHIDAKVLRVGGTYRGGSRTVHDVNDVDIYVFSCTIGDALGNDKIYLRIGGASTPEDATLNYGNVTFLNTYNISGITELSVDADAVAFNRITNPETEVLDSIVRIRRDSDGVEVNVDFDSDRKVSASSAITNTTEQGGESGSTTATDLNGFLNETLTVGTAVNGTGAVDNYTLTNESTTGFSADNSAGGTGSAGFPYAFADNDVIVVRYTVSNFSSTSSLSPQIRGTNGTASATSVASGGTTILANGTYTDTLTATADGTHLMFADGNTGSYTISDFEIVSHTHSAFVHTWYDQAGSNDAVQSTAANQPKIAENGLLLADGIDFDGTNHFLSTSSSFSLTSSDDLSFFTVYKPDVTNAILTVLSQEDGTGTGRGWLSLRANADISTFIGGTGQVLFTSGSTTNEVLTSVIYDDSANTIDGFKNAVNGTQVTSITAEAASGSLNIGESKSSSERFNGTMKEIIVYLSDQTDNRFKIESNINSYYGLYNDANEVTGDFIAVEGSGNSFTPNGTDGFILDIVTSTGYAGIQLNKKVTSGDDIFISFNADINRESTPASFNLALRKTSVNGTISSSQQFTPTQGFNSYTLTSNDSDAEYIAFGEGSDNVGIEVTDFKVSRIARNGFVETWYDQSGNGEDMTQGTAGKQPSIVKNGGQVKDYNGNNSIDFVSGSTRVLDKSGTTTAKTCIVVLDEDSSGSAARAILGFSDSTSFMRLDTSTDLEVKAGGGTANYRAISTNTTALYFWYTNGTDEDKLFENNVEINDTSSHTPPNLPFTRIGARNSDSDPYNSTITEVIAFAEDLSSDRTVLQDDVNNNYNIF